MKERVAGVWKKETSEGKKYYGGQFNNGKKFAIFVNERKEKENQPDLHIVMDYEDAEEMDLVSEYTLKKHEQGYDKEPF